MKGVPRLAASLLGHLSLDTTRGYTAVFPEHLIAAHEALIERRRKQRPDGELRSASGEEWAEFEQHFLLRKVALGDCHRPYGTPCVHEHACLTEMILSGLVRRGGIRNSRNVTRKILYCRVLGRVARGLRLGCSVWARPTG